MRYLLGIFLLGTIASCNWFEPKVEGDPIARVNENYLYREDIASLIKDGTTAEDSAVIVNNYINRWATRLLLLNGAERNLSDDKMVEFNKLVDQYKSDLYTKAYMDALVSQNIDSTVSTSQANEVYEKNRETFKLNEELVKLRYINISNTAINLDEVEERFKRFDEEDKNYLDSISVQFKSFSLKDSIWVKASQVVEKIPVVNAENKKELLKKSNFVQLKDSLSLYLVQVNDVLLPDDYAPLEYVKPTVDQIVINKRKLELIKQLEKDITKDAIKNNRFEIYK